MKNTKILSLSPSLSKTSIPLKSTLKTHSFPSPFRSPLHFQSISHVRCWSSPKTIEKKQKPKNSKWETLSPGVWVDRCVWMCLLKAKASLKMCYSNIYFFNVAPSWKWYFSDLKSYIYFQSKSIIQNYLVKNIKNSFYHIIIIIIGYALTSLKLWRFVILGSKTLFLQKWPLHSCNVMAIFATYRNWRDGSDNCNILKLCLI